MKLSEGVGKNLALYALALGVIYILIGFIEFATGFIDLIAPGSGKSILGLPIDLYGGFAALVIGIVFLGATPLWKARYESIGYILVGALLSATFGGLYLLIVGADGLGTYLAYMTGEEEWTWEWLTVGTAGNGILRLEVWLSFLSIPLGLYTLKTVKEK